MMYDIYEIQDSDGNVLEKIYQPSEPMYNTDALTAVIKKRVSTQTGLDEDDIKLVSKGQTENVGGESPKV